MITKSIKIKGGRLWALGMLCALCASCSDFFDQQSEHVIFTDVNHLDNATDTIYSVTVTDSLGCTWTGQIPIHCTEVICGEPNVFIPNTFSPNGDGINDRLCFSGKFITGFYIAIYTRWGEKVYETHDINDCWDGRYNDNWCMPGVYTYTCRIQCEAGLENLLKGDITLIR